MTPLGMSDLLILIGRKEVELALLRQQIVVLTEQLRQAQPAAQPAPAPEAPRNDLP